MSDVKREVAICVELAKMFREVANSGKAHERIER